MKLNRLGQDHVRYSVETSLILIFFFSTKDGSHARVLSILTRAIECTR